MSPSYRYNEFGYRPQSPQEDDDGADEYDEATVNNPPADPDEGELDSNFDHYANCAYCGKWKPCTRIAIAVGGFVHPERDYCAECLGNPDLMQDLDT